MRAVGGRGGGALREEEGAGTVDVVLLLLQ